MSYDITKHLSYSVAGSAQTGSPHAVFASIVLRPLGAAVPPTHSKEVLAAVTAEARRVGQFQPGRLIAIDLDAGPNLPPNGLHMDLVVVSCGSATACETPAGSVGEETQISIDQQPVRVLEKCHMLPYEDAKPPNPNLIYDIYLKPYLLERCGPLHKGFEFAFKECRFQVLATIPASEESDTFYVGRDTVIFSNGPPIQRSILKSALILPFFQSLPTGGNDDEASREAAVRTHFGQRSAPVQVKDEFVTTSGARFRVMKCEPSNGGIMPSTKISCTGPALMSCGICGAMAVRRCEFPECGMLLCTPHTKEFTVEGAKKKSCPEHADRASNCAMQ